MFPNRYNRALVGPEMSAEIQNICTWCRRFSAHPRCDILTQDKKIFLMRNSTWDELTLVYKDYWKMILNF